MQTTKRFADYFHSSAIFLHIVHAYTRKYKKGGMALVAVPPCVLLPSPHIIYIWCGNWFDDYFIIIFLPFMIYMPFCRPFMSSPALRTLTPFML